MVYPVSRGIQSEGKVMDGISVDFVIELKEDTEASVCKDDMRRFGKDMVVRESFFGRRESFRCQELLDGEM
jgi:hypothetical protein